MIKKTIAYLTVFIITNSFVETTAAQQIVLPPDTSNLISYYSEDITFENRSASITLAGTLTLPQKNGKYPAVVLISGNGEQNRDAEISGHKPFLVMAEYLTKNGIAVLRFDKRGVGLSEGDYKTATTLDLSTDVQAAFKYLQTREDIYKSKIGLIGHSEGGLIAPIVASKLNGVAFIVLLAAPGISGDRLLLSQQRAIAKASGVSKLDIQKSKDLNQKAFEIVKSIKDPRALKIQITDYIKKISKGDPDKPEGMTEDEYVNLQVNKVLSPWMVFYLRYNPAVMLKKLKCSVLALNGSNDLQVLPKENLNAIKTALIKGGNKKFIVKELPELNHLFQESKSGLPNEYENIEQSFSPIALKQILNWIKRQIE